MYRRLFLGVICPWLLRPRLETGSCCGLQEAVDKGWFRKERDLTRPGSGVPYIDQILAVALDIAEGMAFLHAQDVVHGDLTGGADIFPPCSKDFIGVESCSCRRFIIALFTVHSATSFCSLYFSCSHEALTNIA